MTRASFSPRSPLRPALIAAGNIFGGVERFVLTYARHLNDIEGVEPFVILFHAGHLYDSLIAAGISVRLLEERVRYSPSVISDIAECLRERGITLVHTHGYKATILGTLAARRLGVPVVKTEHSAIEPARGIDRLKMILNHTVDRWISRFCVDEIVYVSRDLLEHKNVRSRFESALVIHNGIDPPVIDDQRTVRFGRGRFDIGIVGRVSPVKGHDVLVRALTQLPADSPAHVHVIGDGPVRPEIERLARELGVGDRITFHGFRRNVHEYIAALDCIVMPSLSEGAITYSLLEAMHLGVPVIASAVGGMREVLRHAETALLVRPGDSSELAAALRTIMDDDALRERMRSIAGSEVARSFRVGDMADRYLAVYEAVRQRTAASRAWITWDAHRRSIELAQALGLPLRVFGRGRNVLTYYAAPLVRTVAHLCTTRYDTIVVQNPSLVLTTIASFLKRWRGYGLVQDLHSYFASPTLDPAGARDRVYAALARYCVRRADLTIVTNDRLEELIDAMGGRGFALQDKVPELATARTVDLGPTFNVVFVCTYAPDEPLDAVLQAAATLDGGVTVYVTGHPRRSAEPDRLPSNVVLTGFLDEPDYAALLRAADAIIVLTTRDHTLLCGAYEAIAARKPLITSDTDVLRRAFGSSVIYVDNSADAIVDAVDCVRRNGPALAAAMDRLAKATIPAWNERLAALESSLAALPAGGRHMRREPG
jgi:glycosyltransferase involved in cell wall biosynthesis